MTEKAMSSGSAVNEPAGQARRASQQAPPSTPIASSSISSRVVDRTAPSLSTRSSQYARSLVGVPWQTNTSSNSCRVERTAEAIAEIDCVGDAEIPDMTLVGGHSSHSYLTGTNLYFVHYYDLVDIKPEEELTKYHHPIKKIIVEETIKLGGSMCHHAWCGQTSGAVHRAGIRVQLLHAGDAEARL